MATDLDGTLLDRSGRVSNRTRAVLEQLEERGVPVVFVTGRPIRWMEHLWEAVGGHGLAICSNGAVVYDVATHTVQRALTIDPDTALEVARRLRTQLPGTHFARGEVRRVLARVAVPQPGTGTTRDRDWSARSRSSTTPSSSFSSCTRRSRRRPTGDGSRR